MRNLKRGPVAKAFGNRKNSKPIMPISALFAALCTTMALSTTVAAPPAEARSVTYSLDIPSQSLNDALQALALASQHKLLYSSELVDGKNSPAIKGQFTTEQAVKALLSGSNLTYEVTSDGLVLIRAARDAAITNAAAGTLANAPVNTAAAVAQNQSTGDSQGSSPDAANSADRKRYYGAAELDEVVVTATKRAETVHNISGSLTALTGDALEQLGAQDLADFITRVPGVVLNQGVPGLSPIVIRGVSTTTAFDTGQGPTGYFINDVPLSDPFSVVGVPDIDTFDLDNVTVLRGPQGTLFGSASLGGAVNYQAAKPNLNDYQLHVQLTGESAANGGDGGGGKLMLNAPLLPGVLAVRGVYYFRNDPGYYTNIGIGEKNSNNTLTRGGRIEATWAPTSTTTINYMFFDQTQYTADQGYQEPVYAGPLEKNTAIAEPNNLGTLLHNLRLDQDLGFATLTATATYHDKTQWLIQDATYDFSGLLPGVSPLGALQTAHARGMDYELRLVSPIGKPFDYVVGVMRDDIHENFTDTIQNPNAPQVIEALYAGTFGPGIGAKSAPGGVVDYGTIPFRGREEALFGEASYHFNDQWKLTLGGRAFRTESSNVSTSSDFLNLLTTGELSTTLSGSQRENGFLPKASFTWTPTGDVMAYALVSKGFRFGGPNIAPSLPGAPVPPTFGSDHLINYELGTKADWFERRLEVDADVFYIDWSNIQLDLVTPAGSQYAANAGTAHNHGLEGTALWHITGDLSLQTNLTYLIAKLAQDYNPGGGQAIVPEGSILPGASKWQVSNTLIYRLSGVPLDPTLLFGQRYISQAPGAFGIGVPQGDYSLYDLRATMHVKGGIDLSVFVNNIANSRGITAGFVLPPLQENLVRPRTVGLTVDYKL
jgi:iron complex outermembrane recepter protein